MRRTSQSPLVFLATVALLVVTASVAWLIAQPPRPAGPAPGVLVDVGGHELHIRCVGPDEATPVVILEAGGGGFSSGWTPVQERLSPRVRSCAYDRAGSGWSAPGPAPRTMRQEVYELHALLRAAKVPGPYVLVGQSIGGLLVRLYAEQHRRQVAGMVLVDPTHESSVLFNLRLGRWARLRELATGRRVPKPRRTGPSSAQYDPKEDYQSEELQQIYLSRQARPDLLGDRPLIVLAAGRRPAPPGTADDVWKPMRQERDDQVADLVRLSRNAKFVLDPPSGHNLHADNPSLVARAIEEVVAAASTRTRLAP